MDTEALARRPPGEITLLIGAGTRELMLRLLERIAVETPARGEQIRPEAVLASLDHHYALCSGSRATVYDGAAEALQGLRAAGIKTACVTNK